MSATRPGTVDFREEQLVNFRLFRFEDPGAYAFRWVSIKVFELGAGLAADQEVLRALIGAAYFADGYAGGGLDTSGQIHGPYRLACITVEAYEPIEAADALGVIEGWAGQYGQVPDALATALSDEVYAVIGSAESCYRLTGLGEAQQHDWEIAREHFHEFVAVDRVLGRLALIVATDD